MLNCFRVGFCVQMEIKNIKQNTIERLFAV